MEIKIVELKSKQALAIRDYCPFASLVDKFGEIYGEIGAYIKKNTIQTSGVPFGIYHSYSPEKVDLEAGIPVSGNPAGEGRIHILNTYGGKAVMTIHSGSYDNLKAAWSEFAKLVDEQKYELAGPCFEVYVNDPADEPDSSKWITELYTPIK